MKSEWPTVRAADAIDFNPTLRLPKGTVAPKVAMEKLLPFTKRIDGFSIEPYSGGAKFCNGDTIMARITPCLENGKTAFVDILKDDEIGYGSTEYIVLRAKPGISDPQYVYYLATSPGFRNVAIKSMVGSSGRQRVQQSVLDDMLISLPTLTEQREIGRFLAMLDDRITLNNRINDNLEQQAAVMFHELFVTQADPSWTEGTISDLGTVVGGSTPSKAKPEYYTDHGIAWITPKDLSVDKSKFISHGADDITELGLRNSSASIMPEGTVLFSSRAPIGYIAIADGEVTTNQGFKSVVPHDHVGTAFVYYFLKSALPTIEGMASGSTFKEISGSAMKTVPAIIPDDAALRTFASFCDPLFRQQRTLEKQNRELATMRDALLPKLMSGEIDVSDVTL